MRRGKQFLVEEAARKTAQTQAFVREVVDVLAELIIRELAQGNVVTWTGLGTWEPRRRRPPAKLPWGDGSRQEQEGPPLLWTSFRPGQALRRSLNRVRQDTD